MDQPAVLDLKEANLMLRVVRNEKLLPPLIYQTGMVLANSTLLAAHDAPFEHMSKNKTERGFFLIVCDTDILEDHTQQHQVMAQSK